MSGSSNIDSSYRRFPPAAGLAEALGSSNLSHLATKAFADPDAGYPQGLRLNAALRENDSGRFTLVSGLTLAGSATAVADKELDRIQTLIDSIEQRISILQNNTYKNAEYDRQRLLLKFDMEDLDKKIRNAQIGDFNLLDATDAPGVSLRFSTGEFNNIRSTEVQNVVGTNRSFSYEEDTALFQTIDVRAAFEDFRNLELLTYNGTELAANSTDNADFLSLHRFQTVVDNARENINAFKRKLNQVIAENITISTEPGPTTINDGFDARQVASRLGQQLSNDSFNITSNPSLKYFSLFS